MGDDAVIDDDLAERIFESMLIRLQDKFPAVRVQAVAAISRLQDPTDPECIVISTYLKLMSNDCSVEVRRAVLLNIALTSETLEGIIGAYKFTSCICLLERPSIINYFGKGVTKAFS